MLKFQGAVSLSCVRKKKIRRQTAKAAIRARSIDGWWHDSPLHKLTCPLLNYLIPTLLTFCFDGRTCAFIKCVSLAQDSYLLAYFPVS